MPQYGLVIYVDCTYMYYIIRYIYIYTLVHGSYSTCDGNDITVACMDCLGMVFHKMVRNSMEREPKSMMIFLIGHVSG